MASSARIASSVRTVALGLSGTGKARRAIPIRAPLTLTPAAIVRIKQLLTERPDSTALRIGVKSKGCNGLSYTLDYVFASASASPSHTSLASASPAPNAPATSAVPAGTSSPFPIIALHSQMADSATSSAAVRPLTSGHQTANANANVKANSSPSAPGTEFKAQARTSGPTGTGTKLGLLDAEVVQEGVRVLIDAKAQLSLLGSEMDYLEHEIGSEFIFRNPNIKGVCGCGESFTI